MEWLNYHHLLYFWVTAKEGGIAKASVKLRLAQPTISGQIRMLEESLGEKLFQRAGRGLSLTEVGRVVFRYADEIFTLGRELRSVLRNQTTGRPARILVGITDTLPKLVAYRLLRPALDLDEPAQLLCREARPEQLFSELATHSLDLVLSDVPLGTEASVRAYNHLLGESPLCLLGAPALCARHRPGFPRSLDDAPFLLPGESANLRRTLLHWFEEQDVEPRIAGEFDDSALLKVFGQAGVGFFCAPTVIAQDICEQYGVEVLAQIEGREQFYVISPEKRIKHPGVAAIVGAARRELRGAG